MKFILDNVDDIIQNHLARGEFYEKDYLEVMKKYCPENSTILDIGANVGQFHSLCRNHFSNSYIFSIEKYT